MKAPIIEIFSSFQGEGLWIGRRQIFVRFAGCNLSCNYCDTSTSQATDNGILMSVDEVLEKIEELKTPDLHSISFTGGEPLLYPDFINAVINKINVKVMIETNGTLPDSLSKIDRIDCVSLDIKLPEHFAHKWEDSIFENELLSIKLLLELDKKIYCKLVVSPSTKLSTIKEVGEILANIITDKKIPIVLQPASPIEQWKNRNNLLFEFSELIGQYLEVLTIPQIHKFLNIE
jgi:7-carboxy-7-deazaguanine synthase